MKPVTVQLGVSALFLLAGLWLQWRSARRPALTVAVLLATLVALLLYTAHFAADHFTSEGINESVLYHLRYGLEGAGFAEYAGLSVATAAGVALCVGAVWWLGRATRANRRGGVSGAAGVAALACVCASVALQPASATLLRMLPDDAEDTLAAHDPARQAVQAEFDQYYQRPVALPAGRARNLVYIYLESLERTYFDEQLFPGLVPGLRALERQAVSFTGVGQVTGTEWTIAGMVASQCGIPLFTPSGGNTMTGMDAFLAEATCTGDLLKRDGYHLVYYGGAKLRFAGKGKFYETHGFHEIMGRDELLPRLADPDYVNAWGLYDDSLFELAFAKYQDLVRSQRRFAMYMLTLDTHQPDGHVSAACKDTPYGDGSNPMLNSVHCSDRLVSDFVRRIRNAPGGEDTVIVLASDHLALQNTAYHLLAQRTRHNLLMVLDPRVGSGQVVSTPGSTLDVPATVLPFIGYDAQVGLGTDLRQADAAALARSAHVRSHLAQWRAPLLHFWQFPTITQTLEVDASERLVKIDGRPFAVPALIEVDGAMHTVIRFPKPRKPVPDIVKEGDDKPFLLVAHCGAEDKRAPDDQICLFAGRDQRLRSRLIVRETARFTPEDVRRLVGLAS